MLFVSGLRSYKPPLNDPLTGTLNILSDGVWIDAICLQSSQQHLNADIGMIQAAVNMEMSRRVHLFPPSVHVILSVAFVVIELYDFVIMPSIMAYLGKPWTPQTMSGAGAATFWASTGAILSIGAYQHGRKTADVDSQPPTSS